MPATERSVRLENGPRTAHGFPIQIVIRANRERVAWGKMTKPSTERQRASRQRLAELCAHPNSVYAIHYACESFCDTAGWAFGGSPRYAEMTLAAEFRKGRMRWLTSIADIIEV